MNHSKLSLPVLLTALATQKNDKEYVTLPNEAPKATTFRLEPDLRKFCEDQAIKLGVSLPFFIRMTLRGVMIHTSGTRKVQLTLMVERFFELFEKMSIPIADIPEILRDFNFKLSDLADRNKTLDKLSPKLLSYLSERFKVNRRWLEGLD